MVNEVLYMWISQYNYPTPQLFAKAGIGFLVGDMWEVIMVQAYFSVREWSLIRARASLVQIDFCFDVFFVSLTGHAKDDARERKEITSLLWS
jgi:hypothetical protein